MIDFLGLQRHSLVVRAGFLGYTLGFYLNGHKQIRRRIQRMKRRLSSEALADLGKVMHKFDYNVNFITTLPGLLASSPQLSFHDYQYHRIELVCNYVTNYILRVYVSPC